MTSVSPRLYTVGIVLCAIFLCSTALVSAASNSQPEVRIEGDGVSDGTTTLRLKLSSAPNGISGYKINVSLESGAQARITSVSYPDAFSITNTIFGPENTTVQLEGVDISNTITAGATNITLATITVANVQTGSISIHLTVLAMDDDQGYAIEPAVQDGTIVATHSTHTDDSQPSQATDDRAKETTDATEQDEPSTDATGGMVQNIGIVVGGVGAVFLGVVGLYRFRD